MAKKKWWKENCEDLKELYEKVRSDFLFNKRKLKIKIGNGIVKAVKNKNGSLLTNRTSIVDGSNTMKY